MTAFAMSPSAVVPVTAWGTARILAGTSSGRLDLSKHREVHGQMRPYDAHRLADATDMAKLLGRGGAAFPVARKLRVVPAGRDTHVLANGSEGEPASHKDRVVMRLAPHLVLDGVVTVARALETERVSIVVQDADAFTSLADAMRERSDTRTVRLVRHQHGFVGGEVRSVIRALSNGPATPPGRRVLPTEHGIDGRATFASNIETFAQIALLVGLGVDKYTSVGGSDEPGTTLVTMLGDVPHPGVVEIPTGMPLAALIGADSGPVLVGGYHGTWIREPSDLVVSRPALRAAGVPLNAGVIARLPTDGCHLGEVAKVADWLAAESAGQCGPCFFGLPALATSLHRLFAGEPAREVAQQQARLLPGRGACAHPDGASGFVASALDALTEDIARHQGQGRCGRPILGVLPTSSNGVPA